MWKTALHRTKMPNRLIPRPKEYPSKKKTDGPHMALTLHPLRERDGTKQHRAERGNVFDFDMLELQPMFYMCFVKNTF
jgi:hypothetical protein